MAKNASILERKSVSVHSVKELVRSRDLRPTPNRNAVAQWVLRGVVAVNSVLLRDQVTDIQTHKFVLVKKKKKKKKVIFTI